jgi:hypothetical protein
VAPKLKLLGFEDTSPVLAAPKMLGFAALPPVVPVAPLPAGVPKENALDPVPEPVCAAPPDACFPPNRPEPGEAGVLFDEAPPKRLEPPPVTAPKRGLDAGVFEPVLVLFAAFPNRDGVDPPEVLPAPKRGCFGVLLPPDPKVNPDIA